jgi:hypothetical protein
MNTNPETSSTSEANDSSNQKSSIFNHQSSIPSHSSHESQQSRSTQTSPPSPPSPPPPPAPRTPIQIIFGEIAVELYSLATTGKSAKTAINPDYPPDKYPIIFRQYADKLPEAIDNYLCKPVSESKSERFPHFRQVVPRDHARSIHLDKISVEDQEQIYQWTEQHGYERALDRIACPPPIGLGINTSIASLQRLRTRRENAVAIALAARDAQLINSAEASDPDFIQAAARLLRLRALETAKKSDSKTSELRDLFGILDRIRARDQTDRKLALMENDRNPGSHDDSSRQPPASVNRSLPTSTAAPPKTESL